MANTKTVNVTEEELKNIIASHGCNLLNHDHDERIERINYLNKRLKAFAEPDKTEEVKSVEQPAPAPATKGVW